MKNSGVHSSAKNTADIVKDIIRENFRQPGQVPLHAPKFDDEDCALVEASLREGWVSTAGHFVSDFESRLAEACDVNHAIATANGTSALHLAFISSGVGEGDAVVCPALTFVATANAISYTGATPIFLDSTWHGLGLDPDKFREFLESECSWDGNGTVHRQTGLVVRAVVPVHIFGHAVDMDPIIDMCRNRGIKVVEDSAEALGTMYKDRYCGGLGELAVLSFNGNKTITTGGGGAVLTNDDTLATRLKHLSTTARVPSQWNYDHDELGYNYRLPSLNAALGCSQIAKLPDFIRRKRRIAEIYRQGLEDIEGVEWVSAPIYSRSNFWLNAIAFQDRRQRDLFLELTNRDGIETRPCWTLMPDVIFYRDAPISGDLSVARDIADRLVNLPSSPWMVGN